MAEYGPAEWVNIYHETFCVHYPVRVVVTEHVNVTSRHQFKFSWKVTSSLTGIQIETFVVFKLCCLMQWLSRSCSALLAQTGFKISTN